MRKEDEGGNKGRNEGKGWMREGKGGRIGERENE